MSAGQIPSSSRHNSNAVRNGIDELHFSESHFNNFRTGIARVDDLLKTTVLEGTILEICGRSGVGKTQFCLTTIANNLRKNPEMEVLYINTKLDFSIVSFLQILKSGWNHETLQVLDVLNNLKIENALTAETLLKVLEELNADMEKYFKNLKLVIVDSMPAVFLNFKRKDNRKKRGLIMKCAREMLKLCRRFRIVLITVNYTNSKIKHLRDFTMNPKAGAKRFWNMKQKCKSAVENELTELHQAMGVRKHWYYVPSIRLFMSDLNEPAPENKRIIQVWHAYHLQEKSSCVVEINDNGVV